MEIVYEDFALLNLEEYQYITMFEGNISREDVDILIEILEKQIIGKVRFPKFLRDDSVLPKIKYLSLYSTVDLDEIIIIMAIALMHINIRRI